MITAGLVVGIVVVATLVADVYLVSKGGFQATISWWIYTNWVKYPIIPFAFGVLMGHFFWNQSLNVSVTGGCSQ